MRRKESNARNFGVVFFHQVAKGKLTMGEKIPTLPCIRCEKPLESVDPEAENQPSRGTEFFSYGHYGSAYDPGDGTLIIVNLCDDCLLLAAERQMVLERRDKPVTVAYSYNYLRFGD